MIDTRTASDVGPRLRAIRKAKGMSLEAVADASGWSASAWGTWERNDRALSVPQLHRIAQFYDVPLGVLLTGESNVDPAPGVRRLVFDLGALTWAPTDAERLRLFVRAIIVERGDFNGQILTLRQADLPAITALIGADTGGSAIRQLEAWRVLT